jgi:hypothetical protein
MNSASEVITFSECIYEEHSWPDELSVKVSLKLHKYSCIEDGERENNETM